jgi:hypothetical protein
MTGDGIPPRHIDMPPTDDDVKIVDEAEHDEKAPDGAVQQPECSGTPLPIRGDTSDNIASNGKIQLLGSIVLYHLPSLCFTITITILYSQNWLWPGSGAVRPKANYSLVTEVLASRLSNGPTPNQLAALQFAAKLNEALVVISLSQIIFHRLRYLMLRANGAPLGLLASQFHLGNPLYLLTPEFLGTLRGAISEPSTVFSVLMVFLIFGIAIAAGPFSAILMIPRQRLWILPASHPLIHDLRATGKAPNLENGYLRRDLNLSVTDMYPMSIGPDVGISWSCSSNSSSCLSFFQRDFESVFASRDLQIDEDQPFLDGSVILKASVNLRDTRATKWRVNNLEPWIPSNAQFAATVAHITEQDAFIQLRDLIEFDVNYTMNGLISKLSWATEGQAVPRKQPLVLGQCCAAIGTPNTTQMGIQEILSMNTSYCFHDGFYSSYDFRITQDLATQLAQQNWTTGFLTFFDILDSPSHRISTAAVTALPLDIHEPNRLMDICIFEALWAEAEETYAKTEKDVYMSMTAQPGQLKTPVASYLDKTKHASLDEVVRFDSAWINSLDISSRADIATYDPLDTRDLSLFQVIAQNRDSEVIPLLLALIMSAAQCSHGSCIPQAQDGEVKYLYNENATSPKNPVHQELRFYQDGYGYGFYEPVIILGFVILYIHTLIVLVHVFFIVLDQLWTSNAWPSVGELIVMGLCSTPPDLLRNVRAGDSTWRKWQFLVSTRQISEHQQVEFVILDPGGKKDEEENQSAAINAVDPEH